MIKSDCKAQQGDHTVERTKRRTEAAGTEEGEGWAESSGLGADPALTKVPCGCVPCVQPTFTPCGGVYVRTRDPKEASLKTPMDLP